MPKCMQFLVQPKRMDRKFPVENCLSQLILAKKLHGDAISESETAGVDRVKILPYDGVAPSKYLALFQMKPDSRKRDGRMIKIAAKNANPRLEKSLEALPALEGIVVKSLISKHLIEEDNNEKG